MRGFAINEYISQTTDWISRPMAASGTYGKPIRTRRMLWWSWCRAVDIKTFYCKDGRKSSLSPWISVLRKREGEWGSRWHHCLPLWECTTEDNTKSDEERERCLKEQKLAHWQRNPPRAHGLLRLSATLPGDTLHPRGHCARDVLRNGIFRSPPAGLYQFAAEPVALHQRGPSPRFTRDR